MTTTTKTRRLARRYLKKAQTIDQAQLVSEGITCVVAFLMGACQVLGGCAPFGAAFYAVADLRRVNVAALLCVGAGSLCTDQPLRNLLALATIAAFKAWMLKKRLPFTLPRCMAMACGALVIWGTVFVAAQGMLTGDVLLLWLEVGLCALACGICYDWKGLLRRAGSDRTVNTPQAVALLGVTALCIVPLSGFFIGDLSVGRTVGVALVVVAARTGSLGGCALCGTVVGLCAALGDRDYAMLCLSYGAAGLFGAAFAPRSRFSCGAAFLLVGGMFGIWAASGIEVVIFLMELTVGTGLALLPSNRDIETLRQFFLHRPQLRLEGEWSREMAARRLRGVSEGLKDLCETVQYLSDRLQKINYPDPLTAFDGAVQKVCANCAKGGDCFLNHAGDTADALNRLLVPLNKTGELTPEQLSAVLPNCTKPQTLSRAMTEQYRAYLTRRRVYERQAFLRGVTREQFYALSICLEKQAEQIEGGVAYDGAAALRVEGYLHSQGINAQDVAVGREPNGRVRLEALVDSPSELTLSSENLLTRCSELIGQELTSTQLLNRGGKWQLLAQGGQVLRPTCGVCSLPRQGERHCGDCGSFFDTQQGQLVGVLCDGMGTGSRAAVDAEMAKRVVQKIMQAGFESDFALSCVNSALCLQCDEDRPAAVDVAVLDRCDGRCSFVKAGGAPTFVRRGGTIYRLTGQPLPAGVFTALPRSQAATLTLRSGDIVLMVSDGVCAAFGEEQLERLLKTTELHDPDALAKEVLAGCSKAEQTQLEDDCTAMVMIV